MSEQGKSVIPIPYFFSGVTMVPIFIILFGFPGNPKSDFDRVVEFVLSNYLLGQVGYWSSNFSLSSMLVANYISVLGPVFSLVFFYKVYQGLVVDPGQYKNHTFFKYILAVIASLVLVVFWVYVNYFSSVDLGAGSRKWRILGEYKLAFALFSSGLLFAYYSMTIFLYAGFFYLPRFFIKRWKQ